MNDDPTGLDLLLDDSAKRERKYAKWLAEWDRQLAARQSRTPPREVLSRMRDLR